MNNYEQPGDILPLIAPYDLVRGQACLIGVIFSVATNAAKTGEPFDGLTTGVVRLPAPVADVGSTGDRVYWDAINRRVSVSSSAGKLVGILARPLMNGEVVAALSLCGTGVAAVEGGGGSGGGTSVSSAPATNILTDTLGRPISYTVAGVNKTVTYGLYGIASISGSDGNVDTYSYDAAGNLTGIVNSGGSTGVPSAVTYDTDNTVLSYAVAGVTYSLTYVTNARGKQVSTISGGGHVTTYSYDVAGNFTGSTTV